MLNIIYWCIFDDIITRPDTHFPNLLRAPGSGPCEEMRGARLKPERGNERGDKEIQYHSSILLSLCKQTQDWARREELEEEAPVHTSAPEPCLQEAK